MSEIVDITVGVIQEEITISAVNNIGEITVNAVNNSEEINVTANTNLIQININTGSVSIINPQNYDLSQFTNTSPNPFVQQSTLASYVPISRTLTINGTTLDLSADRSWTISTNWGSIGGSLSSQGDLVAALAAKQDTLTLTTTGSSGAATLVGATLNIPNYTISGLGGVPSSRTLTINGTTYDLSADRTWTIATGLTIGTTPIASGTVGRVLFEGTGNVLQESANLFWDDTNGRFQVGTSSTSPFGSALIFMGKDQNAETNFQISNSTNGTAAVVGFRVFGANNRSTFLGEFSQGHTGVSEYASHYVIEPNAAGVKHGLVISLPETTVGSDLLVYTGGRTSSNKRLTLFQGTGNLLLQSGGTHTDAGFRLDARGNTRVGPNTPTEANAGFIASSGNHFLYIKSISSTSGEIGFRRGTASGTEDGDYKFLFDNASAFINYNRPAQVLSTSCQFHLSYVTAGSERGRWTNTGNFLINTTTDAGFRLDVNGTARVSAANGLSAFQITAPTRAWYFTTSQQGGTFNAISGSANGSSGTGNFGYVLGGGWAFNIGLTTSQTNSFFSVYPSATNQGEVRIGGQTGNGSSLLTLESTTKGFLPPRGSNAQMLAIASPATGLIFFDNTNNKLNCYDGTTWQPCW